LTTPVRSILSHRHSVTTHGVRAALLRAALLPAAAMLLVGGTTAVFLGVAAPSAPTTRIVLLGAGIAAVLVLVAAYAGADIAIRRVHVQLNDMRSLVARGLDDLYRFRDGVKRGEYREPPGVVAPPATSDPFELLAHDLRRVQRTAQLAVLEAAAPVPDPDQRVEVFVNLAWRMQSLVHREIQLLDELEAQVEDPDLLKGLFTVDHLATLLRRQTESLAVLGGAASRRRWSSPVTMYDVLRSAVAEVEQYSRVKLVLPIDGMLHGDAVAHVIHLVAELVENATKFSPPETPVLIRAEHVTAGLAIEVDDRGLGIPSDDRRQMNAVLADPGQVNIGELLRDGRIGLFVVSALARRHGVKVELQRNVYGGTQAIVVLPAGLVNAASENGSAQPAGTATTTTTATTATTTTTTATATAATTTATAPAAPPAPAAVVTAAAPVRAVGPPVRPDPPVPAFTLLPGDDRLFGSGPGSRDTGASGGEPGRATDGRRQGDRGGGAERPPLPQRRVQENLAPQLREAPASRHGTAEEAEPTPDLMADFLRGVSRSAEDDRQDGLGGTADPPVSGAGRR
jgi:signal transduction histidine kinase